MKNWQTNRKTVGFTILFLCLAFVEARSTTAEQAVQPDKKGDGPYALEIQFSTEPGRTPDADQPIVLPSLRPNVQQQYFLYVKNLKKQPVEATVELRAGGQPVDGGKKKIPLKEGDLQLVNLMPAAPGLDKGPPSPAKAPDLAELKGQLEIRVVDDAGKDLAEPRKVGLNAPLAYVKEAGAKYDAEAGELVVTLKADSDAKTFVGPPARVELVLRPDRIAGFIPDQKREGSYVGWLTAPKDEVRLVARSLRFQDGSERRGLVYVTVDGYQRAFTFYVDFNVGGQPPRVLSGQPILRLGAAPLAAPGAPLNVGLEVDNAPTGSAVKVGLYRNEELTDKDSLIHLLGNRSWEVAPDRSWRVFFSPQGPEGALMFRTEARDWNVQLDTAGIFGERWLGLQLDPRAAFINSEQFQPANGGFRTTEQIIRPLGLDATRPEGVEFVQFPKTLPRGSLLPVKVAGFDPESGIRQVLFLSGKLPADGKISPDAVLALLDDPAPEKNRKEKKTWEAQLPVATEKAGKVEVTVQLTNGAGLTSSRTAVVQLVDPPADAGKGARASIAGTVSEGGRAQPNLSVWLFDPQGVVRDSVTSDGEGRFLFKDVASGTYRVVAVKSGSNTRGEAAVQVQEGQKKTGVDVKMVR